MEMGFHANKFTFKINIICYLVYIYICMCVYNIIYSIIYITNINIYKYNIYIHIYIQTHTQQSKWMEADDFRKKSGFQPWISIINGVKQMHPDFIKTSPACQGDESPLTDELLGKKPLGIQYRSQVRFLGTTSWFLFPVLDRASSSWALWAARQHNSTSKLFH